MLSFHLGDSLIITTEGAIVLLILLNALKL